MGEEDEPLSTFDFASDAKDKKRTARAMLAMVAALNAKTLPDATGLPDAKVHLPSWIDQAIDRAASARSRRGAGYG